MIDREELQQIEQRAKAARRAVETVEVHTDGGLFGEIPPSLAAQLFPATVASVRDVPRLLAEVELLSPAEYWVGDEECMERECDGYVDEDGAQVRDFSEPCPHVEVKVATLGDVKRAEYLDILVRSLKEAAEREQRGEPADNSGALRPLAELILTGAENTYHRIAEWESTGEEPTW